MKKPKKIVSQGKEEEKREDFFKGANDVKCVFDAFVIQSIKERYIIKDKHSSIQQQRKR